MDSVYYFILFMVSYLWTIGFVGQLVSLIFKLTLAGFLSIVVGVFWQLFSTYCIGSFWPVFLGNYSQLVN